jgi:hypothetical protein
VMEHRENPAVRQLGYIYRARAQAVVQPLPTRWVDLILRLDEIEQEEKVWRKLPVPVRIA